MWLQKKPVSMPIWDAKAKLKMTTQTSNAPFLMAGSLDPDHSAEVSRRFDFSLARKLPDLEAQLRAFNQKDSRTLAEEDDSALDEKARDVTSKAKKRIDLATQTCEKLQKFRKSSYIVLIPQSAQLTTTKSVSRKTKPIS